MKKVLVIAVLLLVPLVFALMPGDEIPDYFGPPWEVWDGDQLYFWLENVSTGPENLTFLVHINDTDRWVANGLYYSIDGGAWKLFKLDPDKSKDAYLELGSATVNLSVPNSTDAGFVIMFSCKEFPDGQGDPVLRCGCRAEDDCNEPDGYWAIQDLEMPEISGGAGGELGDCRLPANTCPADRPFCNIATGGCDECMVMDTTLCEDLEVCVQGTCSPVQCVTNADCVGMEGSGVRRSVCHPLEYRCVACNNNVDCMFSDPNGTDITGTCDSLGNHTCTFISDLDTFCKDECMPDDVLNYGGVGKCEGNDMYHCHMGGNGCYEFYFVKTCSASCEKASGVAYCSESPPTCGRPCVADGACNPYCESDYDPFCKENHDPDCPLP